MMMRVFAISLLPFCSLALSLCVTCSAATYPLKVSSTNKRLLVDQNNAPFLLVGDSPHALIVNLNVADATRFFEDRRTNGFNSMWIEIICEDSEAGRIDGSLLDGTTPFTSTLGGGLWDMSTPNDAYFAHVDAIIRIAATNGIQILMNPADTGGWNGGWTETMLTNGSARCRQYGQYLGSRYKDFPNLIWFSGNDFQAWQTPTNDAVVSAIARGIKDFDTNHLQTVQFDYPVSASLDNTNWASIVNLNFVYSYYAQYERVQREYKRTNVMPIVMIEGHYEYQTNYYGDFGTIPVLRRQMYWSMLSGAIGHCYGNDAVWPFQPGWDAPAIFNSQAISELKHVTALFQSRRWHAFAPDINRTVLTAGFGTYATNAVVSANNFATCSRETNGHTVMVYAPTQRAMTIDMTKISGTNALAWWFDPRTGVATNFGPFATTGTRVFTPPTTNDWVLVLDDAAQNFPAPGAAPLIAPLEMTTGSLPGVSVGGNYSMQLTATGGVAPHSWSLAPASAALPAGLSLSQSGMLSGIPTSSGTFILSVHVTDAEAVMASRSLALVVSPVPLTISADNSVRSYGATNPALTGSVVGLLPFDNITAGFTAGATTNSPVGIYPISVTLGGPLGNYLLTINGGNLTVTPASLLVTAGSINKPFGTAVALTDYSVAGLLNNDSVTNLTLFSAGSGSNAPVGSYAINASGALGVGLTNYVIGYSNGTLTVGVPDLLIVAGSTNKVYGATLNPVAYVVVGLLDGDSVTNVILGSAGSLSNAPAGNYSINASAVEGVGLEKYSITYSNGTLAVGMAGLLVAAQDTNKVYGAMLDPAAYTAAGLSSWDSVTNVALASAGSVSNASVGSYAINVSDALGVGLSNYVIGYTNGTLTVGAAELLITAASTNKIYGTTLTPVDYIAVGLVNGDSVTNVSLSSAGTVSLAPVGSHPIQVSAAEGLGLTNYSIVYSNGTLTVMTPQLLIAPVGTNEVVLSWPAPTSPFTLQENADPTTTNWMDVTSPSIATGDGVQVALPATNGSCFYRLFTTVSGEMGGLSAPQLFIAPTDASGVVISWPASAPLFAVEMSTDLAAGYWVTVTNWPSVLMPGTNQIILPATNQACFFRLTVP